MDPKTLEYLHDMARLGVRGLEVKSEAFWLLDEACERMAQAMVDSICAAIERRPGFPQGLLALIEGGAAS